MRRWILHLYISTLMAMGAAVVSVPVSALTINDTQKLLASDGSYGVLFGYTVAIDGDTAVIGAPQNREYGGASGAAYVFSRDAKGMWSEQVKLLASDAADGQYFGTSVAIAGDIIVIGAPGDNDKGRFTGSAYIFTRDAAGAWNEQAKLLASDGAEYNHFGNSVAVSGDMAVVGSVYDDDSGILNSGSAYVFIRDADGNWSEQAKLVASEPSAQDRFGGSVAVSGDTVLMGREQLQFYVGTGAGEVRVFARDPSGNWSEQAKLMASDGMDQDGFGHSVALAGTTALIGAWRNNQTGTNAGAAYVFTRDATGTWREQARIVPDDGMANAKFGWSVALRGERALIGAWHDNENGTDAGAAYLFTRHSATGTWSESTKLLPSDGAPYFGFGHAVSLSGDTALVGIVENEKLSGSDSRGWAYSFSLPGTAKEQLNSLFGDVEMLVEENSLPRGLLGILKAVGVSLDNGNSLPALNKLQAFINQVTATVRSKRLTAAEGAELIDAANQLILAIEAGN